MKKIVCVLGALFAGLSLNAAVVATVDGKNITDTQINEELKAILGGRDINTLPTQQKSAIIQQYIAEKLLLAEAKKQNFEKTADYSKALEGAKDQIIFNLYQKKLYDSVKVDNAKIKAAYDKNKSQFVRPATVQVRHILVGLDNEAEAKSIINELKNLKGDALKDKFSQIASEKSMDTNSAQQGGALPEFTEKDMVKPFSDAAFSLKKGEITKTPVKTEFGYHIIFKENAQARKQLSFNEVKAGLENDYKMAEMQKLLAQKVQELSSKAKIELK